MSFRYKLILDAQQLAAAKRELAMKQGKIAADYTDADIFTYIRERAIDMKRSIEQVEDEVLEGIAWQSELDVAVRYA